MEKWMYEKPIKGDIICDVSMQLIICARTDQWRKLLEDLFSVACKTNILVQITGAGSGRRQLSRAIHKDIERFE